MTSHERRRSYSPVATVRSPSITVLAGVVGAEQDSTGVLGGATCTWKLSGVPSVTAARKARPVSGMFWARSSPTVMLPVSTAVARSRRRQATLPCQTPTTIPPSRWKMRWHGWASSTCPEHSLTLIGLDYEPATHEVAELEDIVIR